MSTLEVKLKLEDIRKGELKADKKIVRQIQSLVALVGQEVKNQVLQDMIAAKTGVQYPVLPYQSSAPGEVPAYQSGKLYDSIQAKVARNGLSVNIEATVDYAVYLSKGKKGHPETKRPIIQTAAGRVGRIFRRELKKILEQV